MKLIILLMVIVGSYCENLSDCEDWKAKNKQLREEYWDFYHQQDDIYQECIHSHDECREKLTRAIAKNIEDENILLQHVNNSEDVPNLKYYIRENVLLKAQIQALNYSLIKKEMEIINQMENMNFVINEQIANNTKLQHENAYYDFEIEMHKKDLTNCQNKLRMTNGKVSDFKHTQHIFTDSIDACIKREEDCLREKQKCHLSLNNCRKRNIKK